MISRKFGCTVVLMGCLVNLSHAATDEPAYSKAFSACMVQAGGVTVDMRECTSAETARQDKQLNKNYQAWLAAVDKKLPPNQSSPAKKNLQKAQRAWSELIKADCAIEGLSEVDGTLQAVLQDSCYLRMTAERANKLHELMKAFSE
jgi:uncharacterized protein YecT (DUF1311 family)